MANGVRAQKVTEDMFENTKFLISRFPNATNKEVGKLVLCPGGLCETTVSKIRKSKTFQDYVRLNEEKFSKHKVGDFVTDSKELEEFKKAIGEISYTTDEEFKKITDQAKKEQIKMKVGIDFYKIADLLGKIAEILKS